MRTAMQNLHERWGLSTNEIAQVLNISPRVVRLARDGSQPADWAVRLDGFLQRLQGHGVEEPAAWMAMDIVEGYTVTRWRLYEAGRSDLVEANAEQRLTATQMLFEFDPDWRANYWTSFTTRVAEDGNVSIRGKTYDEVRAQV